MEPTDQIEEREHHPFGASSMPRRDACSGSYKMEAGLPDVKTAAGDAGTLKHAAVWDDAILATVEPAGQIDVIWVREQLEAIAPLSEWRRELRVALPDDDGTCRFSNGHGYWQHRPEDVHKVKSAILSIAATDAPSFAATFDKIRAGFCRESHATRIIDECCPRPVWRAWHRLWCIDADGKEWGQPYFAMNPSEAEQVCLNPPAQA